MPDWAKNVIWWHVYPIGFLGADPTGVDRSVHRRLDDIEVWLDYAVELGASGLALGPIFQSSSHGYDTLDYFRIDERLGDEKTFTVLVEQCRQRGLRLLLDGVFNHVGRRFPLLERAADHDQEASGWFVTEPDGTGFRTFEGHAGLVTLNHSDSRVADFVVGVMNHWLDAGASGWRLDAAYSVPRPFWADVVARVRAAHPDAYLVGEVIHGDRPGIVRDTGLDSLTQYELWKAIWSSFNDGNLFELAWALKRHLAMLEVFTPLTFIGNHDVTRIASRLDDERHLGLALALLFTLPGTPSVYYGDEQGFRGVKEDRSGGDDAVRPAFPATPQDLAPYGWPVYRLHQLLIGFRRRHAWLESATVTVLKLAGRTLVYECRSGDRRAAVALNLADSEVAVEIPAGLTNVLNEQNRPTGLDGSRLSVPGCSWTIVS